MGYLPQYCVSFFHGSCCIQNHPRVMTGKRKSPRVTGGELRMTGRVLRKHDTVEHRSIVHRTISTLNLNKKTLFQSLDYGSFLAPPSRLSQSCDWGARILTFADEMLRRLIQICQRWAARYLALGSAVSCLHAVFSSIWQTDVSFGRHSKCRTMLVK